MPWLPLAVAFLLLLAAAHRASRLPASILIIAHRGASGRAPENSLAALRMAADLGCAWAEIDVQRTADGVLVLVHDNRWMRTAGLDREVSETPWDSVRVLDVGSSFDERFRGEPPPRLDDVLAWASERLYLNLELKSPRQHPGLGPQVVEAVRRHRASSQVLVTSFDLDLIEALADEAPDLEFGYLAAAPFERRHARVRTWSLHHDLVLRQPDLMREARRSGVRVLAWTVDDLHLARTLVAHGVQGLISNHPERLLRRMRRRF